MPKRFNRIWAIPISLVLLIGIYFVPPVHDRLAWRLDSLRTQIRYLIKPPDEAVFLPTQQSAIQTIVSGTMYAAIQTPSAPAQTSTPKPGPTSIPTVTSTPLPATVML